jgi:PAS domain S-box-containing protein
MGGQLDRVKSFVARVVAIPAMRDPADAISASLVGRTIDVLLVGVILFWAAAALAGRLLDLSVVTLLAGLLMLIVLRWLLGRGHVQSVGYALCSLGWLLVGTDLQLHGPDTIAVGGYVVLIVVGGLTLGLRGAVALTAATVALLAPFLLGAVRGGFVAPTGRDRFIHYTTQLVLAGTLAGWWASRTRRLMTDLRRSEMRRSLLLEESPDSIVSADATGVMTFQNRATVRMLGYPASEIVGRPWFEVPPLRGVDAGHLASQFSRLVKNGNLPTEELTLLHRDGHPVVVDVKGMPLYEDGKMVGSVAILRDITARKKAEAERASLQRQLASAQRLEAVGRVAGGVAHDFNNLLTIILAAADTGDSAAMDDIREAARRGVTLTRQLLTFGGRKSNDPRPIDLHHAMISLRPMLARVLGADVTLELRLAKAVAAVVIDAGQLDQVLVNLVANARDAMPRGGTVTLATELKGDCVELRVVDTGSGMDAATLASAFEPFFTTKGDRGTGLGLAVVHNIVQEARGTIRCTSEPGRGTTFTLGFPVSAAVPPTPVAQPPGLGARAQRIVLVDDDALVRQVVVRALKRAGFAVDAFEGGQDVSAIEARLDGADALVTDLVMPGTSGVDLALELRRRHCEVPILFVSGTAEHALISRVREVPRASFLEKPFSAQDVVDRVGEIRRMRGAIAARPG